MSTAAALLAAALALDAVAFRRAAAIVAAVVAFYVAAVVAAAVAASAAAVAVAVVVVGLVVCVVDGASVAPTSPGYLARAVDAPRPVYGPALRRAASRVTLAVADVVAAIGAAVESAGATVDAAPRAAIRFLAPTWDLDVDGIGREINRLSDCLARATATRHRARAAHYAERIAALDAIRWGATLH